MRESEDVRFRFMRGQMSYSLPSEMLWGYGIYVKYSELRRMHGRRIHSSRPKDIKKSLDVLSEPFPDGTQIGNGAGTRLQFAILILRASTQYLSLFRRLLSNPYAARLNTSAAFLSASSLPPMVSCALKASTELIADGLVTMLAVKVFDGKEGTGEGSFDEVVDDKRKHRRSLACVISPRAMLRLRVNYQTKELETCTYKSCGEISMRILNNSSGDMVNFVLSVLCSPSSETGELSRGGATRASPADS